MQIITKEHADYKGFHLTGYFRDGQRRVDLVIVSKDDKDEDIEGLKINFLINAMRAGIQFEIDAGVKHKHRHLLFIKVHAPDHVITHFGFLFNIRKYFKSTHTRYIDSAVKGEKHTIDLVRQSYPGPANFSTMERSMIVYRTLLLVTFGEPRNYVGIQRAVDSGIFLDVYPLHDGPHFMVRGQFVFQLNGRQSLFYTWVGYSNLLRLHPVHLIREYLGERIGFLFACSQYILYCLLVSGLAGVGMFYLNYFGAKKRHIKVKEVYKKLFVAPKCSDFVGCPIRELGDYEREMEIKLWLDNPYTIFYIIFVAVTAIFTFVMWRRREYYLCWMWEIDDEDGKSTVRSRFTPWTRLKPPPKETDKPKKAKRKNKPKKQLEMEWIKRHKRLVTCLRFKEFLVSMLMICLFFLLFLPGLLALQNKLLNRMRYVEELVKRNDTTYKNRVSIARVFHTFVVDVTANLNGFFILFFETVWVNLATWFAYLSNSRTENMYERSLVVNLFGYTFLINFAYIFFVTFIKGLLYTSPDDMERWNMPVQIGMMNCGMLYCIDEAFIAIFSTFKMKKIIQEILNMLKYIQLRRDVPGEAADDDEDVPCWEREFELMPLTEDYVMNKFNQIFLYFAFGTFFAWVFPLAPLLVFMFLLWETKAWAKEILLFSRRPLITQSFGIGTWYGIFWLLPYVAALINLLGYARNSSLLDRQFEERYYDHSKHGAFINKYFATNFPTKYYTKDSKIGLKFDEAMKNFKRPGTPSDILFPGQYFIYNQKYYTPGPTKWYINWHQALVVMLVKGIILLAGLFLHYMIEPCSVEIREIVEVEKSVRNYQLRREMLLKNEEKQVVPAK